MKQHKGYYIDNIIFNSTEEIDSFLKAQAVETYKKAVKLFVNDSSLVNSIYCSEKAENLVEFYGFSWDEVEAVEISVMQAGA